MIFALACVEKTTLPDLGDCAVYPDGVYEYGEIGIGSCLAGPNDLALLAQDTVLAVSNANPWADFTGGSVAFYNLATLDEGSGRNLTSSLAIDTISMPSYSGTLSVAEPHDLLLVANKYSEGARTRESDDAVWFVDVSDPAAPALAEVGTEGAWTEVGWDPNAILYDTVDDLAFVVNRSSHSVSMLDMGDDPIDVLPPGGDGSLEADDYDDADASGSSGDFVTLDEVEGGFLAHAWSLRWNVGTFRAWVPVDGGAARLTGNGEGLWEESTIGLDVDLETTDGAIETLADPGFFLADGVARLLFVDQDGAIRQAGASSIEEWTIDDEDTVLSPRDDEWDAVLGGPSAVASDGAWYVFYDGGDGVTQKVGLAITTDGSRFSRYTDGPVLAVDEVAVTDPFVMLDPESGQWRMFYTRAGNAIGQAESDDLVTWTERTEQFAPEGGAAAPAVGYSNGRFHMFTTRAAETGWEVIESVSIDGYEWTDIGPAFALASTAEVAPRIALQVAREEAFRIEDESGEVFPLALAPGDTIEYEAGGWAVRVAAGFVASAGDDGDGVEVASVVGSQVYATVIEDGVSRVVALERDGDDLLIGSEVLVDPADIGADSVSAPVVVEGDAGLLMLFARTDGEVTTIARATSVDGFVWDIDEDAVLTASDDWESVSLEPGSIDVADDGTLRLWYAGYDGARWRVGLAESSDGLTFTRVPGDTYAWTFDEGAPGDWNDSGVRHPWVRHDGDDEFMWFSGYDGASWQIGYAERSGADAFDVSTDAEGTSRPALQAALGGFGHGGVQHPVVLGEGDPWEIWYAGTDGGDARVGRAVATDPDRIHRDLRMPTLADAWGFVAIPPEDADAVTLDANVGGVDFLGLGCSSLAQDVANGFLYVGCKLANYVYVLDIRDDSTDTDADLNYLQVEAVLMVETSTAGCIYIDQGDCSGLRYLMVDPARGRLWGVADEPEALYAFDLDAVVDDDDGDVLREELVLMLPLPRSGERDEGVDTQSYVGPAQIAMHPDGHHMFVTNFNDNSLTVYDLDLGAGGTLVAEAHDIGENPYAMRITGDGSRVYVVNYTGEVEDEATSSTIVVIDADPESDTFLDPLTWIVNK